jgi:hypothetical protein
MKKTSKLVLSAAVLAAGFATPSLARPVIHHRIYDYAGGAYMRSGADNPGVSGGGSFGYNEHNESHY